MAEDGEDITNVINELNNDDNNKSVIEKEELK